MWPLEAPLRCAGLAASALLVVSGLGLGGGRRGGALWLSQFHWATVLQLVVLELLLLSFWSAAEGPLLCAGCMLAPALLRPVQSTQNQLGPWAGRTGTSLGVYSL